MYQNGIYANTALKPQSFVVFAALKLYVDAAFLSASLCMLEVIEDSAVTV